MRIEKKTADQLAKKHGWHFLDEQPDIGLVSYEKIVGGWPARINIYMTKATVGTCLDHPKQGKSQLFRRLVDPGQLESISENPRVHTSVGYKLRRKNP